MCKEAFSDNFSKMFPEGRIFINYVQLRQAIQLFFKHWNLVCKSTSKTFRCSYSHTPACKRNAFRSPSNDRKRHLNRVTEQVQCPFEIRWALIDHFKPIRNDIFYKVKITKLVSTQHSCRMSNISYRHAMK